MSAARTHLGALRGTAREVRGKDARGEAALGEEAFKERRCARARDRAEREPEQPAARVVHKVLRLGAHRDEALRAHAQRADRDGVLALVLALLLSSPCSEKGLSTKRRLLPI